MRWRAAVLLLCLPAAAAATAAAATDPSPDDCEPLTRSSLDTAAERFDLDAAQTRWLAERLALGALRRAEDLDELPGAGPELRSALETAWCWGGTTTRAVQVASALRRSRVETRVHTDGPMVEVDARHLNEPDRKLLRGGAAIHRGSWSARAGTLALRRGLGLALATPGAEPRGVGPRAMRLGSWRTSTTLDPRVVVGGVLGWERRGIHLEVAHGRLKEPKDEPPARVTTLFVSGALQEGVAAFQSVRSPLGWSHALLLAAPQGPGSWSGELAWSGPGSAQGLSWLLEAGSIRARAGLLRLGAGFVPYGGTLPGDSEDRVTWDLEVVWRGGPSRFLRAAARNEREPRRGADLERGEERVVEVGERLRPGISVHLLWRDRARSEATATASWRETTWRAELDVARRPWSLRARHEDRRTVAGRARHTDFRVGRRGALEWEVRGGFATRDGDHIPQWVHARRAGGLYGWEPLRPGSRWGVWLAAPVGRFRFESSIDAASSGMDVTLSVGWHDRSGA